MVQRQMAVVRSKPAVQVPERSDKKGKARRTVCTPSDLDRKLKLRIQAYTCLVLRMPLGGGEVAGAGVSGTSRRVGGTPGGVTPGAHTL